LSGGILIDDVDWKRVSANSSIVVANLTEILKDKGLPKAASLFTTERRLIRAWFPNAYPKTAQWGYNSPEKLKYSIPNEQVILE
jgi:hypothetical protein